MDFEIGTNLDSLYLLLYSSVPRDRLIGLSEPQVSLMYHGDNNA